MSTKRKQTPRRVNQRNPKGTGGIYEKNGKWVAFVPVGRTKSGNSARKTKTCDTREEAMVEWGKLIDQLNKNQLSAGPNITFRKFAEEVLFDNSERWKGHVADGYYRTLSNHVFPVLGGKKLSAIRPREVQALLDNARRDKAAQTVNNIRSAMSVIFKLAMKQELVNVNPLDATEKFKRASYEKNPVQKPWSEDEVDVVSQAFIDTNLEAFVLLSLSTGARTGELRALHWSDIDFEAGTINIDKTLDDHSIKQRDGSTVYRQFLSPPKTQSSIRVLDVFWPILDVLRRHQLRQEFQAAEATKKGRWQEQGLVFTNNRGGFTSSKTIRRQFLKVLDTHSIRRIRLHDMRHTFATLAIERDPSSLAAVSRALGHSSVSITMDRYAKEAKVSHHATSLISDIVFKGKNKGPKADQLSQVGKDFPLRVNSHFDRRG